MSEGHAEQILSSEKKTTIPFFSFVKGKKSSKPDSHGKTNKSDAKSRKAILATKKGKHAALLEQNKSDSTSPGEILLHWLC